MQNSNKFLILVLAALIPSGYFLGKLLRPNLENSENQSSLSTENNFSKQNKNETVPSHQNINTKKQNIQKEEIPKTQLTTILDKYKSGSHHASMKPYFPDTKLGNDILAFAAIYELHSMAGSEISLYADDLLKEMKENPVETLNTLEVVFEKLPNQFASQKQRLLQLASKLEVDNESKIEVLLTETKRPLKRNAEGEIEGTSLFNTSIAFRSLANVVGDDKEMLKTYLLDALEAQKDDPETTTVLIHFFSRYDQQTANELKTKYGLDSKMDED